MKNQIIGFQNIKAILFDVNGTLRSREPHTPGQEAASEYLLKLLGKSDASDNFWEELSRRFKAYSAWAQTNLIQLSESEIWTEWILPEIPKAQVAALADELMMAWLERKGRCIPNPGVEDSIQELDRRGYHLGLISNSMSTLDIPRFLTSQGWNKYFETLILSSVYKYRKPTPDLFLEAARRLQLEPSQCAYVGNRVSKDIVGCKRAGYALGIALKPSDMPLIDDQNTSVKPDFIIKSLSELLDIFKPLG
jgi:putative hydrolase of the HAD superfamily